MSGRPAAARAHDQTRAGRIVFRVLWYLGRGLARVYWRLEIVGGERFPISGAFVLAPSHRSNLDFLLAGLSTERGVRYMAKSSIFKGGRIDRFLYSMGAFPVVRGTADRDAMRRCEELLAAGEVVVLFPEGRRKEGPVIEDLFDGPAFVACRQRVPIIPIGIGGADRAMPIGSKMVWPRKIVITVGEPIYPDVPLTGRVPRHVVSALTADLRDAVQRQYDAAKARVGQP
jgi:1-acyl-sn-glycerol-3-phosphate acyltransferase